MEGNDQTGLGLDDQRIDREDELPPDIRKPVPKKHRHIATGWDHVRPATMPRFADLTPLWQGILIRFYKKAREEE